MQALWLTVVQVGKLLGSQRKLWAPFLVVALVEALFLGLVWLAPQPPFSGVLAPPIRYFFGERVLHYPAHLWFLYHVMKHTHVAAATLVGSFMTGIACVMVAQTHRHQPLSLREALVSKQAHYGRLLVLWLISWGIATITFEALGRFAPRALWVAWTGIGLTVLLQALFVYVIPAAVFEQTVWWKALLAGIRETVRYPLSTLAIVVIPLAAVTVFAIAIPDARVAQWMQQETPEIALPCVLARLVVWVLADVLLTVGAAHLWWVHRALSPVAQRVEAVAAKPAAVRNAASYKGGPTVA